MEPKRPYRKPSKTELAERVRLHDVRVEFIADLMRNLKYRMGVTNKLMAEEWNIPSGAASKIAVEASRIVRAEINDPDVVVSKITAALNWVIDDAIASGDRSSIIKAAGVWAAVAGVNAPMRVSLSQDMSSLSLEQIQAKKLEIVERMRGELDAHPTPDGPNVVDAELLDP